MAILSSRLGIRFHNGSKQGYLPARRPLEIETDLVEAALAAGAEYVDTPGPEVTESEPDPEAIEPEPEVIEPEPVSNTEAIIVAIQELLDTMQVDAFGITGVPHVRAIEKILGFDITPSERDQAWEQMQSGE